MSYTLQAYKAITGQQAEYRTHILLFNAAWSIARANKFFISSSTKLQ